MIALMLHERTGIGSELFTLEKRFADLVDLAKNYKKNGQPVIKDPFVRQKMVSLYTRFRGSLLNYYCNLTHALKRGYRGLDSYVVKLEISALNREDASFTI